jgi:hypothetical protein
MDFIQRVLKRPVRRLVDAITHFLATESFRGEYENVGLFF